MVMLRFAGVSSLLAAISGLIHQAPLANGVALGQVAAIESGSDGSEILGMQGSLAQIEADTDVVKKKGLKTKRSAKSNSSRRTSRRRNSAPQRSRGRGSRT